MSESPEQPPSSASRAGHEPALDDAAARDRALADAVDYRGDVTIETDAGETFRGYAYDHRRREGASILRLMTAEGGRTEVSDQRITRIRFSDKDPAAGKSWEKWVKKYVRQKLEGESAGNENHD